MSNKYEAAIINVSGLNVIFLGLAIVQRVEEHQIKSELLFGIIDGFTAESHWHGIDSCKLMLFLEFSLFYFPLFNLVAFTGPWRGIDSRKPTRTL